MFWRRAKTEGTPELPVENSDEPIRAYKHAFLALNNDLSLVRFMATSGRTTYLPEQYADCVAGTLPEPHDVPDLNCTCGFYAVSKQRRFASGPLVLLVVDLHGKVLEFEEGYRAQYQRVLAAHVSNMCCHAGCWNPYEYLARPDGGDEYTGAVFLCRKHRGFLGKQYTKDVSVLDTLGTEVLEVPEAEEFRLTVFDYDAKNVHVTLTWDQVYPSIASSDARRDS